MPTQLIKRFIEEYAKLLRNKTDYDDFEYGTEVIPGDKTWAKKGCNKSCESCSCKIEGNEVNK
ncbi:hypothetical protein EBT31_23440 [bacterium]|nr:hypothetical protein [bacterium]